MAEKITIVVDFVPTAKYGDNGAAVASRTFSGINFFAACERIAAWMQEEFFGKPWTEIMPKLNMLYEGELDAKTPEGLHISPRIFIGGDRDTWNANPLFLEAIRSFFE